MFAPGHSTFILFNTLSQSINECFWSHFVVYHNILTVVNFCGWSHELPCLISSMLQIFSCVLFLGAELTVRCRFVKWDRLSGGKVE